MIARANENLIAVCYKRIENSYNYENVSAFTFKCRVANDFDKSSYQNIAGLIENEDNLTLYASRLPFNVEVGDKIVVLGQEHIVDGIGYFVNQARSLNAYDLKNEEFLAKCPKGIRLR